ncbi:MAG: flippase-like domain-containing protein, partial [Solirubrobacterales bacterium]|nr:flippase-like domain-containing protein [Solirubrobacterales bacterium]
LAAFGAVLLYGLATLVRGERWHRLLIDQGATPSRRDTHALNAVGYMANNLLPARAGDAVRVVLMAPRAATGMRTVVGTLLAERLLDVAVVLLLFAIVGYGVLGAIGGDSLGLALGIVAAVAVLGAGIVAVLWRRQRAQAFLLPILSSTIGLRSRLGAVMLVVTLLVWAIEAGVWMAVGAAVGFHMDPIEGTYLVALASVFALIPSGPGYAGTQDAAAVIGIRALGGAGSVAVAYLVTLRFVIVVPITVAGLLLAAARYGGVRKLRATRAEASG